MPNPVIIRRLLGGASAFTFWEFTSSVPSVFTHARASNANMFNSSGVLVTLGDAVARVGSHVFNTGEAAWLNEGYWSEEARTELELWNRDGSNAIWTKSASMAAVKNATGLDAVANSATTLTASDANQTFAHTITKTSAEYTMGVYIKRKTGTGSILITDNGFTNETDVKTLINSSRFTLVQITRTQANPAIGIKIVTSGDAIEIDVCGCEAGQSRSSPIFATTAEVTRAKDTMKYGVSGTVLSEINFPAGTIVIEAMPNPGSSTNGGSQMFLDIASDAQASDKPRFNITSNSTVAGRVDAQFTLAGGNISWRVTLSNTDGVRHKYGNAYDATGVFSSFDGADGTDTEPAWTPEPGFDKIAIGATIGGGSLFNGHFRSLFIGKTKDAQTPLNVRTTV